MAFGKAFRRLGSVLTLVAVLGGSLGVIAPLVHAQHHDEDDNRMGRAGETEDEGDLPREVLDDVDDHGHHEAPQISWFSEGPDGEPAFAGRLIAFVIWVGILVYFGRAPLTAFLATRRSAILDGLEEAKRVEAAAHAKHEEYTARIENLDAEIEKLRTDFQRAGMEERDRMVAEASTRANRMHEEAKFLVEQQLKQLREELTREAIEAAVSAAEKILRERATGADQQRLADEYLARLRTSVESGAIKPADAAKGAS
jgi:F-type H+-transporting ATPase subunit b